MPAERVTLLCLVQCQARNQHHRDWAGHPSTESRWRARARDRAHRQRVVADHPLAPAEHVRGGRAGRGGGPRRPVQPRIERLIATAEALDRVMIGERRDRPQRLRAQRAGIGLCARVYRRSVGISSTGASTASTNRRNVSMPSSIRCARSRICSARSLAAPSTKPVSVSPLNSAAVRRSRHGGAAACLRPRPLAHLHA